MARHIAFVLDCSGSMERIKDETISGFNEQLDTVAKNSPDATISLYYFGTKVRKIMDHVKVTEVKPLTKDSYIPSGWTAMYDAIGSAIDDFSAFPDAGSEDTSFIVMIMSDGMENSSREYTKDAVASKIENRQNTGRWTFTYMGANQDAKKEAKKLSIGAANAMSFTADAEGASRSMKVNSAQLGKFLKSKNKSAQDFYVQ